MKGLKLVVICVSIVMGFLLFGISVSAQRVGLPVDERIASLEKKVNALETKNQQLEKDMFSAKLVVNALDKSFNSLKNDYANHYHKIWAATAPPATVELEEKQGKKPYLLYASMEQLKSNGGVLISEPVPK